MTYKIKRQLRTLSDKQIAEDIKKYIKSSYDFYGTRVPEFKVLAKRLHEEYSLNEFYKVFNRFWKSGYHDKMSLAIYTLQLYNQDFDLNTWNFLKPKLKDMKSWDQIDSIGSNVLGCILIKYPRLEPEIMKMAKSNSKWLRRMAIMSNAPLIKNGDIRLTMKLANIYLHEKDDHVQKAFGRILCEAGKIKEDVVKKFILKNIHMPSVIFNYATEDMKELRKLRGVKKLGIFNKRNVGKMMFWKENQKHD